MEEEEALRTSLLVDIRSAIYRTNELLDELLEPYRQQREVLSNLSQQLWDELQRQGGDVTPPKTGPGGAFIGGNIVPFNQSVSTDTEEEMPRD